jgi:hypothetical protein
LSPQAAYELLAGEKCHFDASFLLLLRDGVKDACCALEIQWAGEPHRILTLRSLGRSSLFASWSGLSPEQLTVLCEKTGATSNTRPVLRKKYINVLLREISFARSLSKFKRAGDVDIPVDMFSSPSDPNLWARIKAARAPSAQRDAVIERSRARRRQGGAGPRILTVSGVRRLLKLQVLPNWDAQYLGFEMPSALRALCGNVTSSAQARDLQLGWLSQVAWGEVRHRHLSSTTVCFAIATH